MTPAPALRRPAELAGPEREERQGVKGASASSSWNEDAGADDESPSRLLPLADAVDEPGTTGWYVLLALLVAFSLALLMLQRRDLTRPDPLVATAAPPAPGPAPPEASIPDAEPARAEAAPAAPGPEAAREAADSPAPAAPAVAASAEPAAPPRRRSAAVAAAGLASVAVSALLRRRRR
jgi:hypothetical protein